MFILLFHLLLMSGLLFAVIKGFQDIPLLHNNPIIAISAGVILLLLILWIFPRIIGFFIKMAFFSSIVLFISNSMGWKIDLFNTTPKKKISELSEQAKNLTSQLDNLALLVQPNTSFKAIPTTAISGNKLEMKGQTIQLYGIDTPDLEQPCKNQAGDSYACGEISQSFLRSITLGQEVSCISKGKNHAGNPVAVCSVNGKDLASSMVQSGWAIADPAVSSDYIKDEKKAYRAHTGLWSGKFQSPWSWRLKNVVSLNQDPGPKQKEEKKPTPFQKVLKIFGK